MASSVSSTFAPGITAPDGSETTPVNCEVYVDCANAGAVTVSARTTANSTSTRTFGLSSSTAKHMEHPLGSGTHIRGPNRTTFEGFRFVSFTYFLLRSQPFTFGMQGRTFAVREKKEVVTSRHARKSSAMPHYKTYLDWACRRGRWPSGYENRRFQLFNCGYGFSVSGYNRTL